MFLTDCEGFIDSDATRKHAVNVGVSYEQLVATYTEKYQFLGRPGTPRFLFYISSVSVYLCACMVCLRCCVVKEYMLTYLVQRCRKCCAVFGFRNVCLCYRICVNGGRWIHCSMTFVLTYLVRVNVTLTTTPSPFPSFLPGAKSKKREAKSNNFYSIYSTRQRAHKTK